VLFSATKANHVVYVRSTLAGAPTLTVSAATLTGATQLLRVQPGAPVLTLSAGMATTVQAFGCLSMQAARRDAFGNPVPVSTMTAMALSATPGLVRFYADPACAGAPVTSLSMSAGSSTLNFGVRPITGGSPVVQATLAAQSATASLQVDPAVRRGTCSLTAGALSTTCAIAPAQRDLTKTLFVVQAIVPGALQPGQAQVVCRLQSTSVVSCTRGLSGGAATIAWQTLELPTGLTVARGFDPGCPASLPLVLPVDPATSFSLSSISTTGADFGQADTTTSRLSLDGRSMVFNFAPASPCEGLEFQVATMSGVSVERGAAPGFTTGGPQGRVQTVGGLPQSSNNSVLVSQSASFDAMPVPPNAAASMCHFFTRGELDSATVLRFTRGATVGSGCDSYAMGSIAWQRIDFGSRATVQPYTSTFVGNVDQLSQDITSIDTTRTLVFSGGMMASGLATGETAHNVAGNDDIGDSVALFQLINDSRVTLVRGDNNATSTFTWYAVQFEP
jgi:hypothetical protein